MKHELKSSADGGDQSDWMEEKKEKLSSPVHHHHQQQHHNHSNGGSVHATATAAATLDKLGKMELSSPRMKRASKHVAKLKMGDSKDDIHVSIMCLRAIMNNKYGFNLVIKHSEAITCIALSLNHKSLRTKALVLELLAAICLVKGQCLDFGSIDPLNRCRIGMVLINRICYLVQEGTRSYWPPSTVSRTYAARRTASRRSWSTFPTLTVSRSSSWWPVCSSSTLSSTRWRT